MKNLVLALALLGSEVGLACSLDTECGVGSTCIKSGSSVYGVCTVSSYGHWGKKPEDSGTKPYGSDKAGDSCTGSYECGVGGQCIKVGSAIYGVCTK